MLFFIAGHVPLARPLVAGRFVSRRLILVVRLLLLAGFIVCAFSVARCFVGLAAGFLFHTVFNVAGWRGVGVGLFFGVGFAALSVRRSLGLVAGRFISGFFLSVFLRGRFVAGQVLLAWFRLGGFVFFSTLPARGGLLLPFPFCRFGGRLFAALLLFAVLRSILGGLLFLLLLILDNFLEGIAWLGLGIDTLVLFAALVTFT